MQNTPPVQLVEERTKKMESRSALSKREYELCIFFKNKACLPSEVQFKECIKCHKCTALTRENVVSKLYNHIIGVAVLMMSTYQVNVELK